ncbi:sulfite exporter TauE/SafE family protein [Methyloglobulus sp.]|uniref:sulfite exporter TauE/SafE family protein n=1 Tax=Methyloglobulus sp. TaxID=2518622 RepID=UPI0032B721DE
MTFDPSFTTSYLVAFTMGFATSLHCMGMCGSIIGTLTLSISPDIRNSKRLLIPFGFNYNFGRITNYTLAGALAGIVESFIPALPLRSRATAYCSYCRQSLWLAQGSILRAGCRALLILRKLALALTTDEVTKSALTMLSFGLCTLPAMMGVGIMTSVLTEISRIQRFKQAVSLFMILLALLAAAPWLNPMAKTAHSIH